MTYEPKTITINAKLKKPNKKLLLINMSSKNLGVLAALHRKNTDHRRFMTKIKGTQEADLLTTMSAILSFQRLYPRI